MDGSQKGRSSRFPPLQVSQTADAYWLLILFDFLLIDLHYPMQKEGGRKCP